MQARGIRRGLVLHTQLLLLVCLPPSTRLLICSRKSNENRFERLIKLPTGSGFTLTSSKGACDIIAGVFSCATGNTAGVFTVKNPQSYKLRSEQADTLQSIDGVLAYAESTAFYAAAVPIGSVQQKVLTTVDAVAVSFVWQII